MAKVDISINDLLSNRLVGEGDWVRVKVPTSYSSKQVENPLIDHICCRVQNVNEETFKVTGNFCTNSIYDYKELIFNQLNDSFDVITEDEAEEDPVTKLLDTSVNTVFKIITKEDDECITRVKFDITRHGYISIECLDIPSADPFDNYLHISHGSIKSISIIPNKDVEDHLKNFIEGTRVTFISPKTNKLTKGHTGYIPKHNSNFLVISDDDQRYTFNKEDIGKTIFFGEPEQRQLKLGTNFNLLDDFENYQQGLNSKYKYPNLDDYELTPAEVLKLGGYSGNQIYAGYPGSYNQPGESPEYDIPQNDEEIFDIYAEDFAKKFFKLNYMEYNPRLIQVLIRKGVDKILKKHLGKLPSADKIYIQQSSSY